MVEVSEQWCGVAVGRDPEEVPGLFRDEGAEVLSERWLHVVGDRDDLPLFEKAHDPLRGLVGQPVVFLGRARDGKRRQLAVALLLQLERGPGPVQLAA